MSEQSALQCSGDREHLEIANLLAGFFTCTPLNLRSGTAIHSQSTMFMYFVGQAHPLVWICRAGDWRIASLRLGTEAMKRTVPKRPCGINKEL